MRYLVFIALSVVLLSAGKRHEFYVSITEIHQKSDTLQVAVRVFTEDLEYVINKNRPGKVFLDSKTEMAKAEKAVFAYLSDQFSIGVAAKELPEEWLGLEYVDDVTWVYAQVILPEDASIAFVRNTLLTETFPDQQNIIHFQTDDRFEKLLTNGSRPEVRVLLQ